MKLFNPIFVALYTFTNGQTVEQFQTKPYARRGDLIRHLKSLQITRFPGCGPITIINLQTNEEEQYTP